MKTNYIESFINLNNVQNAVNKAKDDKNLELLIRQLLQEVATDNRTPTWVIQRLGQCVVDCRKTSLEYEASNN